MSVNEFLKSIIEVASKVKGSKITKFEEQQIIEAFDRNEGSAYENAVTAIEEVIAKIYPEKRVFLEKTAGLNNLQNLLAQMNAEAKRWQKDTTK